MKNGHESAEMNVDFSATTSWRPSMRSRFVLSLVALCAGLAVARAEPLMPLAAHRAAYEITLASADDHNPSNGQMPVAATGLIAYEFRGSACEGYATSFRQVTQLLRSEGDPIASDVQSVTYEDGAGKVLKFDIEGRSSSSEDPPVSGSAARLDSGSTQVDLLKPAKAKLDLGQNVLFPTEHIEHIIAAAKAGVATLQARVYDGSDTGKKVYVTLAVVGKAASQASEDASVSDKLAAIRRWPVTISYFDEGNKDGPPEYVLTFDLYENGVSGSLKLDYGTFTLSAKLAKIDWLPTDVCTK
jgi:EipB-like